jgi:hypothetical protein
MLTTSRCDHTTSDVHLFGHNNTNGTLCQGYKQFFTPFYTTMKHDTFFSPVVISTF